MSKQLGDHKKWKMPEWMEPYRKLIESGCGGQTAEQLLNNHTVTFFNNSILCELIGMCEAKVSLLISLKEMNFLPTCYDSNQIKDMINYHITNKNKGIR